MYVRYHRDKCENYYNEIHDFLLDENKIPNRINNSKTQIKKKNQIKEMNFVKCVKIIICYAENHIEKIEKDQK